MIIRPMRNQIKNLRFVSVADAIVQWNYQQLRKRL